MATTDTESAKADATQARVAEQASENMLGANPFVGLSRRQLRSALGRLAGRLALRPGAVARAGAGLAGEWARVAAGRSEVEPAPGDKRWGDPAFADNPFYRRLEQGYLAWSQAAHRLVDDADLDWKSEERGRFALTMLTEAVAPTNALPGNPAALKRAFDTNGASLVRGARHFVHDQRHNDRMPSTVDRRPYRVGETVATSPGAVVHRSEVCEVIQYAPTTEAVRERPVVYVPPQINKFYVMDLAPGRSFTEHAVSRGLPFFTVSWRNPGPAQRDLGIDAYATAVVEAIDVAREVTGSDDVNLLGLCAGGITSALTAGHLAARGERSIHSLTLAVTILDTTAPATIGMFASQRSVASSKARSARQGVLPGSEMARIFAWLRPNDLVWNYWVNNYLMGNDPPAFDVLAWNDDSTNLPAALHHQFLDLFLENPLRRPGAIDVLGTPIDLSKVDQDSYLLAGTTDHITPWTACYQSTQMLGGDPEFVLSNSGHIQSLVNPLANPKARYFTGTEKGADPQAWLAGATERKGSWWGHWADWVTARSGQERPAPERLGSDRHPATDPAPGRYVRESTA